MTALRFGDMSGKQRAAEQAKQQAAFDKRVRQAMRHMRDWHGDLIPDPALPAFHGLMKGMHIATYGIDVLREAARRLREK